MSDLTVAAAAIQRDGVVHSVPRPGRHHNVIGIMPARESKERDVQGFVLSDGSFADRKRAAAVAIESGQIERLKWPPDLYSEDLW